VAAVVAAASLSDLRTVAPARAPFIFTPGALDRAFRLAEEQGHFSVDAVSPVTAAARIHVPVLLIHGADDVDTPPDHSRRIFDALAGPKRLILVPGAHHNESLNGAVWTDVEQWLERGITDAPSLPARPATTSPAAGPRE
jgi:dipeptidyl aminopeptidase/acylaminoacyl peptidase